MGTLTALVGTGNITLRDVALVHGPRPTIAAPTPTLVLRDYVRGSFVDNGPSQNASVPTSLPLTMNQLKGTASILTVPALANVNYPMAGAAQIGQTLLFQVGISGKPAFEFRFRAGRPNGHTINSNNRGLTIPQYSSSGYSAWSAWDDQLSGGQAILNINFSFPTYFAYSVGAEGAVEMEVRIKNTASPVDTSSCIWQWT